MDQTDITAAIRFAIREPSPRRVSDTDITNVTLRAARILGLRIKEKAPSFFAERKSLTSNSNVFAWPSACTKIVKIWDYGGSAGTITGAADSGSGLIRITEVDHGYADEDIVTIHDVVGCTEANGTWQIDLVDDDTYDLLGSTFSNAYTSGGKSFEEKTSMVEITKINISDQSGSNSYKWYPRGRYVVVDDTGYTYDIIIDYEYSAIAITDIPVEYHEYLISWPVVNLIDIPDPESREYHDRIKVLNYHQSIIKMVDNDIDTHLEASSEPTQIRNVWGR